MFAALMMAGTKGGRRMLEEDTGLQMTPWELGVTREMKEQVQMLLQSHKQQYNLLHLLRTVTRMEQMKLMFAQKTSSAVTMTTLTLPGRRLPVAATMTMSSYRSLICALGQMSASTRTSPCLACWAWCRTTPVMGMLSAQDMGISSGINKDVS